MTESRSMLVKNALIAAIAAGALMATVTTASADVACNRYGECWHVKDHYTNFPAELGVRFHKEEWAAKHRGHRYHWRGDQNDDHGYYSHGEWHPFEPH